MGDGKGLQDTRGSTLLSIMRGAWLLQAQAVLLECVANVQTFPETQQLLDDCATWMTMSCERLVFDLKDQWPMHRKRFWCLLSSITLPSPTLRDWQKTQVFTHVGAIMPMDAVWASESDLLWDEDENRIYGDFAFGHDRRQLHASDQASTVLHSWGNILKPCPCQCRGALSMHRLRQGGARGFGLWSAMFQKMRHLHPEEAKLLCTVPLDFIFDMPPRAALCLLGQLAAPLQVLWVQSLFLQAVETVLTGTSTVAPEMNVMSFQQRLLRQVTQRWVTATMHVPRSLHLEVEGHTHEIRVHAPVFAQDLLDAEKKLQGWGQYATLSQDGQRVDPKHILHADILYKLELHGAKQCKPFPGIIAGSDQMEMTVPSDGLGDKLIWECLRILVDHVQGHDHYMLLYPFRAIQLLHQRPHEQVIETWRNRFAITSGHLIMIFEHEHHWVVLSAKPVFSDPGEGLTWTFFDGLRDPTHLDKIYSVGHSIANFFTEWLQCPKLSFVGGTIFAQTHPQTCGTLALAHAATLMNCNIFAPEDELSIHEAFLTLQMDEPWILARGPDDLTAELALMLSDKGVPKENAPSRAQQILAKLGVSQVQTILKGKNPWAALKAAASKPGVMFRLVTADELNKYVAQRARTQHGAEIRNHKHKKKAQTKSPMDTQVADPSRLTLDSAYFQDEDEEPVSQIPFQDVEADQRGVALCTSDQARHFLEQPKSISVDALAIIMVDHPEEEVIKSAGLSKIMFPAYCPGTDEHTVLFGYILQLGDGKVSRKKVGSKSTPDVIKTCVIKFQIFKDQFAGDWDRLTQSPIKLLVQMMDSLQLCRGQKCGSECAKFHAACDETLDGIIFEVWARSFYDDRGIKIDPSRATCFTAFMRTPASALKAILETTPSGVYAEPRGDQPKQHDGTYRVGWLPGDSYAEASHKCKTCAKAICLVRMRQKYGIRVLKCDEEAVWTQLRPGISYVDLEVAKIFELFPLPHGTQRQAVTQLLRDWGWSAKPLQPGRGNFHHMSWRVGAEGPPPHMVLQGFDLEVIVTPVKDLTPQPIIPKMIASQKTQRHLSANKMSTTASSSTSSTTDPWQTPGGGDRWGRFQPTSGNTGKTRLAEIQDQLCSEVKAKVQKELEQKAGEMEVDSDKPINDAQEARFQALEVGMTELRQHNTQFLQWFHEAGDRMKSTEQAVTEVQHTLGQHQQEIHSLGNIFKSSVRTLKEDLSQELSSSDSSATTVAREFGSEGLTGWMGMFRESSTCPWSFDHSVPIYTQACRMGEAGNPGPDFQAEDLLTVGVSNPGGLRGKECHVLELDVGIWTMAETQLSTQSMRPSAGRFRAGGRNMNRAVRPLFSAGAPLRTGSSWAGSWSGVATIADWPSARLNLVWPQEHWSSARVLVSRHWIGQYPIVVGGFYGFAQGPTWPQSRKLSDSLLETMTTNIVMGMQGIRIIQGDFNYNPGELLQQRIWRRYGWCEAQELAEQLFDHQTQMTCKNSTQRDQIWLSPEAASLMRGIHVFDLFADHKAVSVKLAIPGTMTSISTWPRPSKLPWQEISTDDWHPACDLNFSQDADSTAFFSQWSANLESACAERYNEGTGKHLPRSCRGRAQRLQPLHQKPFTPGSKPSRAGEVALQHDVVGSATRRWFKQLRRIQSLMHAVVAGNDTPTAVNYRLELWTSIVRAPGFILEPPWLLDHEQRQLDLLQMDGHTLSMMLRDGWLQHVAHKMNRRTMDDLHGLDGYLTLLDTGKMSALSRTRVSALHSGAFISNLEHSKYDDSKAAICCHCLCPDDRAHWLQCPRFEQLRSQISGWTGDEVQLPSCTIHHLLVPRLEAAVEWRSTLWQQEDCTLKFCHVHPPNTMNHLFVDGTCTKPIHEPLKLAAWSVVNATTGQPVSMGPLAGLARTIARAELTAILAALRWIAYHQREACIWSDSRSTVRVLQLIRRLGFVPDHLCNLDLWQALWEVLQQCEQVTLWIRWIPSHIQRSQTEDAFEDWISRWNDYADALAAEANQQRPPAFWTCFQRYSAALDWWSLRIRNLREFFEKVAEAKPSTPDQSREQVIEVVDSEDEMIQSHSMLEDQLPVNWQSLCHAHQSPLPSTFLTRLITWWCDVEILGSQYYVLSEVEFVFALIADPAFQFPFQLDGSSTWEFRCLDELFQKPTVTQLLRIVKLALKSASDTSARPVDTAAHPRVGTSGGWLPHG
eukprot:Skav206373  [mRNA]  locus=scaffold834:175796:187689:- [translate_table: standard]